MYTTTVSFGPKKLRSTGVEGWPYRRVHRLDDGLPFPPYLPDFDLALFAAFLSFFVLSATDAPAVDPTPEVPLSHRIYPTLDRFSARGWFQEPLPGMRPYSRSQIGRLLVHILNRLNDSGASIPKADRMLIARFIQEFSIEIRESGHKLIPHNPKGWGRLSLPMFSWQDSTSRLSLEPLFRQQLQIFRGGTTREETVSQTYVGGILEGVYRNQFGFRIRHFEAREWSNRVRVSRNEVIARPIEVVQLKGKVADFREAAFQLVWGNKWFSLDFSKSSLDWGPGRSGNLFLGSNAPPFGMIRMKASHGRVHFTHLVGFLHARPGTIDSSLTRIENGHLRTFSPAKYLSAHRVEVILTPRISIGLHEAVIYGHRRPEFLYLPPVSVLAAAQMAVGDKDNLLMGFDISVRPRDGLQTYFSFFMDDLRKFSPGAFSNKFGLQLGLFWVDMAGLRNTDLRMEYVRIAPYVYSHKFNINTHEHYDALLGYPLGPNADRILGSLNYHFRSWLSFEIWMERDREGQNVVNPDGTLTNVGGDAEQGRRSQDPATKSFLAGHKETRTRIGGGIRCEPVRDMILNFQFQRVSAGNVILPSGVRGISEGRIFRLGVEYNLF